MDVKYGNEGQWNQMPPQNIMNELPGDDIDPDYEADTSNIFNQKQMLYQPLHNNRDPRSKDVEIQTELTSQETPQFTNKNYSPPKYGIYDYRNIKMSQNRLLHDLNNLPLEILRDTYFKNRESQLRKSKFEQRDITSHTDKIKQNEELKKIIDQERKAAENTSFTLWDLESEKEMQDKENGYWRGKREINSTFSVVRNITSVGKLVPKNKTHLNYHFRWFIKFNQLVQ